MDIANLETLSPSLRRVLEALLEGRAAEPEDLAALTDAERAELGALSRTAHLARVTLNQPDPTQELEAEALARAQEALAKAGPRAGTSQPEPESAPKPGFLDRLRKLLGVRVDEDE